MKAELKSRFAIGIPTLNRYDLLMPSLKLYVERDFPQTKIVVIDNGNQGITLPGINVHIATHNYGVAASWNLICKTIFNDNHEYGLLLNDDIYLGKKEDEIYDFIKGKNLGFARSTNDWSAFLISKTTFAQVGQFDEQFFPAYYEDKDYEYRMKLKNISRRTTPFLNPVVYRESMTGQKDKSIFGFSEANKQRFVEKWGGLPERETFKIPFNKIL